MRTSHVRLLGASLLAAAITLAMAGCAKHTNNDTRSATQGLPDTRQSLEANEWVLDGSASQPPINSTTPVTLEFRGKKLSGQSPCNTYNAGFTLKDHDLEIGPIMSTKMACENETNSAAEQAYFSAIEASKSVDTTDRDQLVITTAEGKLVFKVSKRAAE
ncbi:MAG: META domain-containing protein [Microthrixaceae bacterium]|nr:META domain-containing protein [Microthrixaceae bacterium]